MLDYRKITKWLEPRWRCFRVPPPGLKTWDGASNATLPWASVLQYLLLTNAIEFPINGTNLPISDQLVPISAQPSFLSTNWAWKLLRWLLEFFFVSPLGRKGSSSAQPWQITSCWPHLGNSGHYHHQQLMATLATIHHFVYADFLDSVWPTCSPIPSF